MDRLSEIREREKAKVMERMGLLAEGKVKE